MRHGGRRIGVSGGRRKEIRVGGLCKTGIWSAKSLLAMPLVIISVAAHGWGSVGHRAVGGVADRLLSDPARAQVAFLLADDRDKEGNPSGRTTLAQVSTWADEIRRTPADRPLWHFDDIPICGDLPQDAPWCPADGACASQKVEQLQAVLADFARPVRERNEALKWIVHLLGDIHQPLHAASNLYARGIRDEQGNTTDRGANDIAVALAGVKTRGRRELHAVWDNDLVNLSLGLGVTNRAGPNDAMLEELAARARAIPANRLAGTPLDWARESNALARNVVYHFSGFVCNQPTTGIVVLDRTYIETATRLIPGQLELAGARLAALLNTSLAQHSK